MDLAARSLSGVLIFIFLWPAIFLPLDYHLEEPLVVWLGTAGLVGFSLLRLALVKFTELFYDQHRRLWLALFAGFSLMQAAIWGALFAFVVHQNLFSDVGIATTVAIAGTSSGAVSSLMPRLWIASTNVTLVLLPAIVICVLDNNSSLAFLMLSYLAYLQLQGYRANSEYQRAFEIEQQLHQEQQKLAKAGRLDPLTRIYNRGHFNTALEVQWHSGLRSQSEQSLLFVDIDHFKRINDQYGHLAGDECLIHIAAIIQQTAKRKTDLIARYGGEEFAVVLVDTNVAQARLLAESIRAAIAAHEFEYQGQSISISASIGVASLIPKEGVSPNMLIDKADKAVYEAKSQGRNCVKVFQDGA